MFDFDQYDIARGKAHFIYANKFEHIYCSRGCAYAVAGGNVQQLWFNKNNYKHLVASQRGAVFDSSYLTLLANDKFRDVWLQVYTEERFESIFGGAISVVSTNVPITLVKSSVFIDNYGNDGASISLNYGGGLFCIEC